MATGSSCSGSRSFKLVAEDEGPEALEGLVNLLERHLDDLRTQGKTEQLDDLEQTLERIRREVEESREARRTRW